MKLIGDRDLQPGCVVTGMVNRCFADFQSDPAAAAIEMTGLGNEFMKHYSGS